MKILANFFYQNSAQHLRTIFEKVKRFRVETFDSKPLSCLLNSVQFEESSGNYGSQNC